MTKYTSVLFRLVSPQGHWSVGDVGSTGFFYIQPLTQAIVDLETISWTRIEEVSTAAVTY